VRAILVHARWASSIIRFHKVSDRLVYVDLLLNGNKYRVIAVYVPHAGYDVYWFDTCFDHLRKTIIDGQRMGFKCMVGGDFNTEQNRGWRGDRLEELLCETDLEVCNKSSMLAFEDSWTFRSVLGTKRVLDYCLVQSACASLLLSNIISFYNNNR